MKTELPEPKSRKAELLYDMIQGRMIAEQDYTYNRFRGDISDLRLEYQLPIRHVDVPFKSKYGHKNKFRKHFLLSIHRKKAVQIYKQINRVA